mmetsp:Transcript_94604/g.276499  ORF Transcript_94604/g.276499 Transcript_94604/m.276499 type:complete len:433 (-) Transcript_94604:327-1625(-)
MAPVSLLPWSSRLWRSVRLAKSSGMGPEMKLPLSCSFTRFRKRVTSRGIGPWSAPARDSNSIICRRVKLPSSLGSVADPCAALPSTSSAIRPDNNPISGGRCPAMLAASNPYSATTSSAKHSKPLTDLAKAWHGLYESAPTKSELRARWASPRSLKPSPASAPSTRRSALFSTAVQAGGENGRLPSCRKPAPGRGTLEQPSNSDHRNSSSRGWLQSCSLWASAAPKFVLPTKATKADIVQKAELFWLVWQVMAKLKSAEKYNASPQRSQSPRPSHAEFPYHVFSWAFANPEASTAFIIGAWISLGTSKLLPQTCRVNPGLPGRSSSSSASDRPRPTGGRAGPPVPGWPWPLLPPPPGGDDSLPSGLSSQPTCLQGRAMNSLHQGLSSHWPRAKQELLRGTHWHQSLPASRWRKLTRACPSAQCSLPSLCLPQ